jgi:hypothetical protein
MRACLSCRRHVRPIDRDCPFCGSAVGARAIRIGSALRRSRTAVAAAFASAAVACGGTVDRNLDASTDGGAADADPDQVTPGFDASPRDASVQDAFIAEDGFCCPLYGGTPSP